MRRGFLVAALNLITDFADKHKAVYVYPTQPILHVIQQILIKTIIFLRFLQKML